MSDKKYAIIGDVHGNWEALSTVLKDAEEHGVTGYVCVGDVVGYNANPAECLEKVRELKCVTVRGNHDHYCSHDECLEDFHPLAAKVVDWTRSQLTAEQIQFLRDLKMSTMVEGFTIVHSTLDMPEKWGYVFDPIEADASFNYQTTSVCFHGHTHLPAYYEKAGRVIKSEYTRVKIQVGRKYFINVGSVGQPRDGDPRSAYAIYDIKMREVELRRLKYDIGKAQEKIMKAGLPERLAKRLEVGK
jgi:diadenosine tetraphosphatase ApaH/serine/threonine PP2A family protein phosphatase